MNSSQLLTSTRTRQNPIPNPDGELQLIQRQTEGLEAKSVKSVTESGPLSSLLHSCHRCHQMESLPAPETYEEKCRYMAPRGLCGTLTTYCATPMDSLDIICLIPFHFCGHFKSRKRTPLQGQKKTIHMARILCSVRLYWGLALAGSPFVIPFDAGLDFIENLFNRVMMLWLWLLSNTRSQR